MNGGLKRLGILAAALLAPSLVHAEQGPLRVTGGLVRGAPLSNQPQVTGFFGIPFAAPPVGDLRWRAPQPVVRWRGVRSATRFGARCMQSPLFSDMRFRSAPSSEDCLTLNVWIPAGAPAGAKLPVLLYIYGGGFMAGDGSERRYDGASMAAHGVVTVTFNYRLGVFGFFAHPGLTAEAGASGNYGLLDQAAALAWVRANIAAFGGDPRRITIGGESAGSMSVSALMASPLTKSAFAGAIGESGALLEPTFRLAPLAEAEQAGARLGASIGATSIAALRVLPADRLLVAQGAARSMRFGPILDGCFLRETPTVTFMAGRQARVPLLVGANSQESGADAILAGAPATVAAYRASLARLFGPRADSLFALFPATNDADVPAAATELASEDFLAHATWRWFDLQRRTGAPTFYYLFARVRPQPLDPALAGPPPLGAVHSAEIEYALGNLDTNPSYAWTDIDRQVSAKMQSYWLNFVKTGDPNGPGLPSWPRAAADGGPIMRQMIGERSFSTRFTGQARERTLTALLPSQ